MPRFLTARPARCRCLAARGRQEARASSVGERKPGQVAEKRVSPPPVHMWSFHPSTISVYCKPSSCVLQNSVNSAISSPGILTKHSRNSLIVILRVKPSSVSAPGSTVPASCVCVLHLAEWEAGSQPERGPLGCVAQTMRTRPHLPPMSPLQTGIPTASQEAGTQRGQAEARPGASVSGRSLGQCQPSRTFRAEPTER